MTSFWFKPALLIYLAALNGGLLVIRINPEENS